MFKMSIPVVMYHHVSPSGTDLNITPEIFEDHLMAIQKKRWKTLTGEEFLHFLQNNAVPKKCVLLTFDDGFADNYIYAYPLLKKYNMKAVLFIATAFVEDIDMKRDGFKPLPHKEAWPLASTERRSEVICTWKELKEMEESGVFDIQSHGHSHKTPSYIKEKKYSEVKNDLLTGKKILEERLSKNILHLAWPKGAYDHTGINIAKELGYEAVYTTERGVNTGKNLTALKRLAVKCKGGSWLISRLNIYSSEFLSSLYLSVRRLR